MLEICSEIRKNKNTRADTPRKKLVREAEKASFNRQMNQWDKEPHLLREADRTITGIGSNFSGNDIPICFQDDPAFRPQQEN